jgi:hypothetical protein
LTEALRLVGTAGLTLTVALEVMPFTLAVRLPVPVVAAAALKVVVLPAAGEIVPGVPAATDQVAPLTLTALL